MRILLDTHVLIWTLIEPTRLRPEIQKQLRDPSQEVVFSVASVWEISIKVALGRDDFRVEPEELVSTALSTGFTELPIHSSAALRVARLPLHHRAPFDRLLVAQAMAEPARLYTADRRLAAYSELVTLV